MHRHKHKLNHKQKLTLKKEPVTDDNLVCIGHNHTTVEVVKFHPLAAEEIKTSYIQLVISMIMNGDSLETVFDAMKDGDVTKSDVLRFIDAVRIVAEALLDDTDVKAIGYDGNGEVA